MGMWNEEDIEKGAQVEYKEHSDSIKKYRKYVLSHSAPYAYFLAREIAIDHLQEDPKYYQKLRKVGL